MGESGAGLRIVLFSGDFARVHYGLAMAAAALAVNRPTTIFFTMGACRALLDRAGWHTLSPGEDGIAPEHADRALTDKGLAGFEELLAAVVALGGAIMVCEMGLRAMALESAPLRPDVPVVEGGLATLLTGAAPGDAMMFL